MAKKGGKTQTVTTGPDEASQTYIDRMRQAAGAGADAIQNNPNSFFTGGINADPSQLAAPWMNAYTDNVVDSVRGDFDHTRAMTSRDARQAATAQGAYGGDRAALTEGARLGAVDRAENSTIAGIRYGAYNDAMSRGTDMARYNQAKEQERLQEPYWRAQQGLGLYNLGMGPMGQTQTTTESGGSSWLSGAAGGALTALGAGFTGGGSLALGAGLGAAQGLWG